MSELLSNPPRDVYAGWLRTSRGMPEDLSMVRERWFAGLDVKDKSLVLFELEMLLKGLVCLGNPRNLPGASLQTAAVAHNYAPELKVLRQATHRSIVLIRSLLGDRDRKFTFSRFLETMLPGESEHGRLVREQLSQDTPVEALWVLRHALGDQLEMIDGLLRSGRVSLRIFQATHGALAREIARNQYFDPLFQLEFRAEFDHIDDRAVMEALSSLHSAGAHRVAALAFLSLFRLVHYLELMDRYRAHDATIYMSYAILGVLRSDLRALASYLDSRAATVIADAFGDELLRVPARQLREGFDELDRTAVSLASLKALVESIGDGMTLEARRCFERELAPLDEESAIFKVKSGLLQCTASLRACAVDAVQVLCEKCAGPSHMASNLGHDKSSRSASSQRERREIFMFRQIVRAFLAKTTAAMDVPDTWVAPTDYGFVRDYLLHFRSIGYRLAVTTGYGRLRPLTSSLDELEGQEELSPERIGAAATESARFDAHLEKIFTQTEEKAEAPFDRGEAIETLKLYLSAPA